jgi:phosphotransferase system HPr-like phosphotransfer protein
MTTVKLNSIAQVKDFVAEANKMTVDISLSSGRYVVDGKSIMGVFSLDLSRPMTLVIDTEDEAVKQQCLEKFKPFIDNDAN